MNALTVALFACLIAYSTATGILGAHYGGAHLAYAHAVPAGPTTLIGASGVVGPNGAAGPSGAVNGHGAVGPSGEHNAIHGIVAAPAIAAYAAPAVVGHAGLAVGHAGLGLGHAGLGLGHAGLIAGHGLGYAGLGLHGVHGW